MAPSWRERLTRRTRLEVATHTQRFDKAPPLDSARYVAVSTGRLEPYLRTLAARDVWCAQPVVSPDEDGFIRVWATKTRAVVGSIGAGGSGEVRPRNLADVLNECGPGRVGAIVDPDLDSELTVEAHHLPTLQALRRGDAIDTALSPVGGEDIVAEAAYRTPELTGQIPGPDDRERAAIAELGPDQVLHRVEVVLAGSLAGPHPYRVYFVPRTDGSTPPLGDDLRARLTEALSSARVLVDPGVPDWRRDLLWDQRAWAVPLDL